MLSETLGAAALALSVPGSAYLAALTLGSVAREHEASGPSGEALRVVIVVPAHNESTGLLRTLGSLAHETATDPHSRVVVVADNCSDDTAAVARDAGVQVLERQDAEHRGKGYALRYAFDAIRDADWFIVVDADTDVSPGFLAAMRRGMAAGADALQCRYGVRDPLASRRSTMADVALGAWNMVRPRGRDALGVSVGILGNGFALSRRTLERVPYTADSIVEDVEYHHMLVKAGLRVRWVDDAKVAGDIAQGRDDHGTQRARWEGGRLRLLKDRAPALLGDMLRGHWRMADALLDLLLLPLAWHVALLLAALVLGSPTVRWGALLGLNVVGLHVAVALVVMHARREHLRVLLGVPAYILWKLCLAAATWRAARRHAAWTRSARRIG